MFNGGRTTVHGKRVCKCGLPSVETDRLKARIYVEMHKDLSLKLSAITPC